MLDALHLRRRITERWSDLVHGHFDDGTVGTVLGLIGTLLQPALGDDAHALVERLGAMLGHVTPNRATHVKRVTILPLSRLAVVLSGV